jgi:hypothetical protein
MMAFKPNYNQQRAERNRRKQAKREATLRAREEAVARRKAEREVPAQPAPGPEKPDAS